MGRRRGCDGLVEAFPDMPDAQNQHLRGPPFDEGRIVQIVQDLDIIDERQILQHLSPILGRDDGSATFQAFDQIIVWDADDEVAQNCGLS